MKIVVIENNKLKAKEIVNKISQSITNAKIFSIFYELNEAIPILIENNIDIVIFDNDNQRLSNEKFIELMEHFNCKMFFIIISKYEMSAKILTKNKYICIEEKNKKQLINQIYKEIIKLDNETIMNKIRIELKKLNFNFSHIGTNYLVRTIYEVYKVEDKSNVNLSNDIFPIVGKEFSRSTNTIHSGLKKAVINMYCDCEESIIKKYFNCFCFEERPRLKEMIFQIIEKI